MGASDPSNSPIRIDLEHEVEEERKSTTDYFFEKIGEAVPLKGDDSNFDLKSLPSQPLAVSERFRLIFVAHSSGFFVVRTKDVIDSAKYFKEKGTGSSVQQLSLVDVSIGRVHILALSTDNSMLAASVSGDIRFFSVDNFMNKEVKQSFSCSLNDSAFVKDLRWITTSENSYVVLSNTGELYYGEAGFPLKYVMDSVEAVDWGVKGTFVAVARKNVLSIFSAKFEEWVSISLSFKSWTGDSASNCSIKVDSVKCIRPDSIIIGCFQLTEDGKEENYFLQVIRSRPGEITDGCSEFVVQSFYDIYQGLIDDIVPFGSGPYLLLTYIEQCQLAINANKKNILEHIMLLGWSVDDDKSEAVVVDIGRDKWLPRIELQENGDDNLLLGLCIDNVSIYQKVVVQHGVEERIELSPYCVLICLTLEGKLVMFHVASLAGSEVLPEVVSTLLGEEDASVKLPVDKGSTFSHGLQKQELHQASEVSGNMKSKTSANPYQTAHAEDFTKHWEVESVANLQSLKSNVQQIVPDVDLNQGTDSHNPSTLLGEENASVKLPVDKGSTFSHGLQKQELDQASEVSGNMKSKTSANPYQTAHAEDFTKHWEVESVANLQSLKSNVRQIVPDVDLNQGTDSHNPSTLLGEEDASVKLPVDKGSTFSHGLQKQELDQASEVSGNMKSKTSANPYQTAHAEDFTKHWEVESVANLQSLKSNVQQIVPDVDLNQGTDSHNPSTLLGEEDASVKLPVDKGSTFSHGLQKQELDQASEVSGNMKSKTSASPYQTAHAEDFTKHWEVESVANLQSLKSNVQQIVPDVDLNQGTDSHNPCTSGEQRTDNCQKTVAPGVSIGSFTVNSHSAAHGFSSYNNLQETTEMTKVLCNTNSTWDTQRTSHLLPGETFSLPRDSDVSSFSTSSYADGVGYQSQIYTTNTTNVHSANVPGSIGGKPLLVHDVNGVSPAINSASRPVQRGGQLTSIGAGNMQPVSVCSSHLFSNGNSTAGKSSIRKLHPSNEHHGPSSKLGISSSDLSKQFGNINEMTKELDLLLRSIEEAGGFRDACTRSLQSSIETVEQGMDTLSKKCKLWMFQVDEHLKEVLYLLNKTIRVVARKVYMEGIYKQASDSGYWDLWNRQKLNSELELKRQRILSLNQDLTYQLIELERHFNALELNKFSQYGRISHGAFQSRYGSSRYIQSLHSLHNAISSQLGAAENLSECLSKQMAALSLTSLSEEQKNVKELFETIGIPYDTSFSSPDMKGFMRISSSKKLLFSDLTTNNDPCKRIQASSMKSCESEMARRRRDSLDQSWTYFEPPKTIIKRKLLQELQKPNWNGSLFSMNEAKVTTSMLEESAPHRSDAKFPSIVFPASQMNMGTLDSHIELEEVSEHSKVFLADNLRAPTQVSESKSHVSQRSNISAVPSSSILAASTLHAELNVDKRLSEENISALPTFGGSCESSSSTIITSSASPLSSSVSSAALPLAAVSVASSRCVTSSNTSIDSNHNVSTSSAPASLYLSNQAPKHTVSSLHYPSCLMSTSESLKSEIQAASVSNLKTNLDADAEAVTRLNEPLNGKSELKLGPSGKFSPTDEQSSSNITSSVINVVQDSKSEQPSDAPMQLSTSFLASASVSSGKNGGLDVGISYEDEMEEEAPETSNMTELHLGRLGGFGISSIPNPSLPKPNPFGASFSNVATGLSSSSISFSVPGGELFRPASFTFPSPQSSATDRSTNSGAFSVGFSAGATLPAPTASVFGQPAQIGSGQQVLGSVLGTFGQSRQLGSSPPGSGFAAPSGYGGGFAGSSSTSGFSSAATGGGFAGIASTGGGFAGIASTGGGFAGVASTGSGFSGIASVGGGFAGSASTGGGFAAVSSTGGFAGAASGGGFGAYSSQGSGNFAAFGTVGGSKPPELFTQMRR